MDPDPDFRFRFTTDDLDLTDIQTSFARLYAVEYSHDFYPDLDNFFMASRLQAVAEQWQNTGRQCTEFKSVIVNVIAEEAESLLDLPVL